MNPDAIDASREAALARRAFARSRLREKRRGGCFRACAITCLVLLVLAVGVVLYVNHNLGRIVGDMVLKQGNDAINGKLTFDKLQATLSGQAVITNAKLYLAGSADPVLTCRRATASVDLLTFFGPNRGRRALKLVFNQPLITLVREADGNFNLARLTKTREEKKEQLAVSVSVVHGTVDFTDLALLRQSYPDLSKAEGVAADFLREAGYTATPPAAAPRPQHEVAQLDGTGSYNGDRQEATFDATLKRAGQGGTLRAKGNLQIDGKQFDITINADAMQLATLGAYGQSVLPRLAFAEVAPGQAAASLGQPLLSGELHQTQAHLQQRTGEALAFAVNGELRDTVLASQTLPILTLDRAHVGYDSKSQAGTADFRAELLGMQVSGKPSVTGPQRTLRGQVSLASLDAAELLAKLKQPALPLQGKFSATVSLGGTTAQPDINAKLASEPLLYDKLKLGRLSGSLAYTAGQINLNDVKLSGGEVPLQASGTLDTNKQTGKLTLLASGIGVRQALDIAARLGQSVKGKTAKVSTASGTFAVKADVTFAGKEPQLSLRAWSERLQYGEWTARAPDISARYVKPSLQITSASASLIGGQPLRTPLYTSAEPPRLIVRAAGRVGGLGGKAPPQLALSGTLASVNLKPSQLTGSFKVAGPATDPELQLQLKGVLEKHPATLTASGHVRPGWSPLQASLNWQQTKIDFAGKVDLGTQQLDGKLSAAAVDLARFSGLPELSGTASVDAALSGKFDKLTAAGKVSAPRIVYRTPQREYVGEKLSAGFKLAGSERISVTNGSVIFEGNLLHADGTLGKAGADLVIASDHFNLLSALALAPPERSAPGGPPARPLQVQSSGPLVVRLTGTLQAPRAAVQYHSGPGSVEGHSFSSAALVADVSKQSAQVSKFELRAGAGSLLANGTVQFKPVQFNGQVNIHQFDVGVLTPLLGTTALAELRGQVEGKVAVNGTPQRFAADANVRLVGGSFRGFALERAEAAFKADANGLELTNLTLRSENTTLTASGSIPRDRSQAHFTASAPRFELALLQPLLPKTAPQVAGAVQLQIDLRPAEGGLPDADISIKDTGKGVSIGGRPIDAVTAQVELRQQVLNVKQLDLGVGSNTLHLSGGANLAAWSQDGQRRPFPLDMNLSADNFAFADVAPLVPEAQRSLLPGGVVTIQNMHLGGTTLDPRLTGSITFAISKVPVGLPSSIQTIGGTVTLTDNSFTIVNVDIGTDKGGQGASLSQATITGQGRLGLNPPRLLDGQVTIDLSPADKGGRFVQLTQGALLSAGGATDGRAGSFDGTVGGTLTLTAPTAGDDTSIASLGGRVVITEAGGTSVLTLPAAQAGGAPAKPGLRLNKLDVVIQEGTEVRYKPAVDLRAGITGELLLDGIPGLPPGNIEALKIDGQLAVNTGSLLLYRHTIRMDDEFASSLHFSGRPGDMVPVFTGRGKLILPHVLTGYEDQGLPTTTGGAQSGLSGLAGRTSAGGARDLTIFFTLNNLKLSPEQDATEEALTNPALRPEISLTSDPPLSEEEILRYLLGGVGQLLAGQGDFGDVAGSELIGFGSSWVSRQLEEALGIDTLAFGGNPTDQENPFYVNIETALSPELSVSYYKTFFSTTNQQEEYGLKYRPFRDQLDNSLAGLEMRINFQNDAVRGSDTEFMFNWTKRF